MNPSIVPGYEASAWVLSRKFWSGGKIGPGDQNFRNIGPGRPFFSENVGPPVKKNGPTCAISKFCLLLYLTLDRVNYYTKVDGYMIEYIVLACLLS